MNRRNSHSHHLIWAVLIGCFVLIVLLLLFICLKGHISYIGGTISLEAIIGIIATFIGVCTAIMLGSQVYSVYNRTQSEREYDRKFIKITNWFERYTTDSTRQMSLLKKSINEFEILKHSVNDALAGIHYHDNKMFKGILNVLDNIVILTNNKQLFGGEFESKVDFAVYAIAKNLTEYKMDEIVREHSIKKFIDFYGKWTESYTLIDFSICKEQQNIRMREINNIIHQIYNKVTNSNFTNLITQEQLNLLNRYIRC